MIIFFNTLVLAARMIQSSCNLTTSKENRKLPRTAMQFNWYAGFLSPKQ